MPNQGPSLTEEDLADFVGAGTRVLIRIAAKLDPALARKWTHDRKGMEAAFLLVLRPPEKQRHPSVPRDGAEFQEEV